MFPRKRFKKWFFKSEIEMTEHGGIFEKIAVAPVNRLAGATQYEARIKTAAIRSFVSCSGSKPVRPLISSNVEPIRQILPKPEGTPFRSR